MGYEKINTFRIACALFNSRYPAFFYGLYFFLGCHFALISFWSLFAAFLFLFFTEKKQLFFLTVTFLVPLPLSFYLSPPMPPVSKAIGKFYIHKMTETNRFSKGWCYQGVLKTTQNLRANCQLYHPDRLSTGQVYEVEGILKMKERGKYSLKLTKAMVPLREKNWTLAEIRYLAKKKTKEYIQRSIPQERAAAFLSALATGELEDRLIANEFRDLGLSHIMAISGFHFGLIAFFFHTLLRFFFSYKINAAILIGILTFYFFFLGSCPSVFRAWVFSIVLLSGQLLERKSSSINSLGIAAIATLLFNPFSAATLSFQLSFLATAGILFFYIPLEKKLRSWLPKLSLKEVLKKGYLGQLSYFATSFFRDAFSLILAVHLPLAPLLFYTFHFFPISSLFYNLFFPFLTAISMLFFLISCLLGKWAHLINGYFTEWILTLTESPPLQFKTVYMTVPAWILAIYLMLLTLAAIRIHIGKTDHDSEFLFRKKV